MWQRYVHNTSDLIHFINLYAADKAIDMFTDLRQWEEAKKFAQAAEKINIMVNELLFIFLHEGNMMLGFD